MNWKRKFALVAVPAVLALSGGALVVQAAPTSPSPSSPASQTGTEPTETTGGAEKVDAIEAPGAGDVGHADAPGANVDHQFEGNE
jgi:hypothetical protein